MVDENDPPKGLMLEELSLLERVIARYPRMSVIVPVVGATALSFGLIRPWDFW